MNFKKIFFYVCFSIAIVVSLVFTLYKTLPITGGFAYLLSSSIAPVLSFLFLNKSLGKIDFSRLCLYMALIFSAFGFFVVAWADAQKLNSCTSFLFFIPPIAAFLFSDFLRYVFRYPQRRS
jgi:hypothetical protein